MGLASQSLIARFYGPSGNGMLAVAMLLPSTLTALLNLGINPANVYYVASLDVSLRKAWYTTVRLGLLICVSGLAVGAALVMLKPQWFSGVPNLALWLSLASFPPSLFVGLIAGLFQARQDFGVFNKLALMQSVLQLACVSALIVFRVQDPSWVIASNLVISFIVLLFGLSALQSALIRAPEIFPNTYKWQLLGYGARAHLSNVAQFLNYKIDIFLVNLFLGPAATGLYVVAVNIAERLWIPSQAASSVILPCLSELSSDAAKRNLLTPLFCRWILLVTGMGAALVAICMPWIITAFFGTKFIPSLLPLFILLPGIVALSASRVLANDIAARGKPELNMVLAIIILAINLAGNIFMIPLLGLAGAALSTTASYLIDLFLRLLIHNRFTRLNPLVNLIPQRSDLSLIKLGGRHRFSSR